VERRLRREEVMTIGVSTVAAHAEAVAQWMASAGAGGMNGYALYEWLVAEHGYAGSYKAVQRFVRTKFPKPRLPVRRRVETPPGAQAQADWAEYPGVRLGGVPAVVRVDNPKTAISSGAGPWGVVNERYAAYARAMRFHVDATRPRAPQEKGKVERRVLAQRVGFDPYREA
jgi:transposase